MPRNCFNLQLVKSTVVWTTHKDGSKANKTNSSVIRVTEWKKTFGWPGLWENPDKGACSADPDLDLGEEGLITPSQQPHCSPSTAVSYNVADRKYQPPWCYHFLIFVLLHCTQNIQNHLHSVLIAQKVAVIWTCRVKRVACSWQSE